MSSFDPHGRVVLKPLTGIPAHFPNERQTAKASSSSSPNTRRKGWSRLSSAPLKRDHRPRPPRRIPALPERGLVVLHQRDTRVQASSSSLRSGLRATSWKGRRRNGKGRSSRMSPSYLHHKNRTFVCIRLLSADMCKLICRRLRLQMLTYYAYLTKRYNPRKLSKKKKSLSVRSSSEMQTKEEETKREGSDLKTRVHGILELQITSPSLLPCAGIQARRLQRAKSDSPLAATRSPAPSGTTSPPSSSLEHRRSSFPSESPALPLLRQRLGRHACGCRRWAIALV